MINVLFVCLGNICRSPMAEAVFQHMVDQAGLSAQIAVDSVGTGDWHIGEPAHHGTRTLLRQHDIRYNGRARQVTPEDVRAADYVVAMDGGNVNELRQLDREDVLAGKLHLLLDFAPGQEVRHVPDPYYAGNFDEVYRLVEIGCQGLLEHIRTQHGL
jgi:protein-tyrosine phosphatase